MIVITLSGVAKVLLSKRLDDTVILVSVVSMIFLMVIPDFPMILPIKALWAKILRGKSLGSFCKWRASSRITCMILRQALEVCSGEPKMQITLSIVPEVSFLKTSTLAFDSLVISLMVPPDFPMTAPTISVLTTILKGKSGSLPWDPIPVPVDARCWWCCCCCCCWWWWWWAPSPPPWEAYLPLLPYLLPVVGWGAVFLDEVIFGVVPDTDLLSSSVTVNEGSDEAAVLCIFSPVLGSGVNDSVFLSVPSSDSLSIEYEWRLLFKLVSLSVSLLFSCPVLSLLLWLRDKREAVVSIGLLLLGSLESKPEEGLFARSKSMATLFDALRLCFFSSEGWWWWFKSTVVPVTGK